MTIKAAILFASGKFPRSAALLVKYRHPVAYFCVGGFAALIHLSVGFSLMRFADVSPAYASLVGFVVANPFSYFGHKLVTFMVPGRDLFEATRFVISAVVGLALASTIPFVLVTLLGLPKLVGLACVVITIPVVNYLAMRFWVFTRYAHRHGVDAS